MLYSIGSEPPYGYGGPVVRLWVIDHVNETEGFEYFIFVTGKAEKERANAIFQRRREAARHRVHERFNLIDAAHYSRHFPTHSVHEAPRPQRVVDKAVDKIIG